MGTTKTKPGTSQQEKEITAIDQERLATDQELSDRRAYVLELEKSVQVDLAEITRLKEARQDYLADGKSIKDLDQRLVDLNASLALSDDTKTGYEKKIGKLTRKLDALQRQKEFVRKKYAAKQYDELAAKFNKTAESLAEICNELFPLSKTLGTSAGSAIPQEINLVGYDSGNHYMFPVNQSKIWTQENGYMSYYKGKE